MGKSGKKFREDEHYRNQKRSQKRSFLNKDSRDDRRDGRDGRDGRYDRNGRRNVA